jgi:hypothetical protein
MIRNVVLLRLKPGADRAALAESLDAIEALRTPGMHGIRARLDAGLREGNWDGAVVADFEDAAAYQEYDRDEEHNRIRQGMAVLVETIARCQLEV